MARYFDLLVSFRHILGGMKLADPLHALPAKSLLRQQSLVQRRPNPPAVVKGLRFPNATPMSARFSARSACVSVVACHVRTATSILVAVFAPSVELADTVHEA